MFSVQEVTILLNFPLAITRKFSIECFYIRLLYDLEINVGGD